MMNERIIKLGLDSGMLNYVDNETPRHYFLCGNADEKDLEKFAELIVKSFLDIMENCDGDLDFAIWKAKQDFGVEE
jgi:hypothetical protein